MSLSFSVVLLLLLLLLLPCSLAQQQEPPQLKGRHFRITAVTEEGLLDVVENDDGSVSFVGYLADMIEAVAKRANFTYTLLPPSGYGSACNPRLQREQQDKETTIATTENNDHPAAYDAIYRTQYNCGTSDVNDLPLTEFSTEIYLGMFYVTPTRQLQNHFTIPFNPPFSGTLGMFGTATGVADFQALAQIQEEKGEDAPVACAPGGTALIDFVRESFPGVQLKPIFEGVEKIYDRFVDGTCDIYVYDGPLASSFVLRRHQRNQCMANGKPIGTIGEPMSFGLSHYAIGVRQDMPMEVVQTLSYWMNVLMSCNPLDPLGPCPDGNFASFYQGRGGTGSECGYVLHPVTATSISGWAILGIVLGSVVLAVVLLTMWHRIRIKRQEKKFAKKSKAVKEQAVRERELNEFIAHEVRNPLASAIAALSFVSSKASDPAVIRSETERTSMVADIQVADSSLQFVSELLRNMLDLSRGKQHVNLNWAPTDVLKDIFEPVASILFMRGAKVDIQTVCNPPNLMVKADRMRLKQIVLNLAANSTKFVEEGFIRLRADVLKDNNVHLYVEDSGPGIPPHKRDRLFMKFQESLDVLNQGTGIGLCVCRNLSEMMGADILLDDRFQSGLVGRPGTRFTLRLNQPPLKQPESSYDPMEEPPYNHQDNSSGNSSNNNKITAATKAIVELPENLSILFVDDDMIIRKMFSRCIQRVAPSWNIKEASNGETALRIVQEEKKNAGTFDIIFIDQYMASVEKQLLGTEAVRLLRAKGVQSIICGLSANDKKEEFVNAGATGFMLKPFPTKKEELAQALQWLLLSSKTTTTTTITTSTKTIDTSDATNNNDDDDVSSDGSTTTSNDNNINDSDPCKQKTTTINNNNDKSHSPNEQFLEDV